MRMDIKEKISEQDDNYEEIIQNSAERNKENSMKKCFFICSDA